MCDTDFYDGDSKLPDMFEVGEFIIFEDGSGIILWEDDENWFEVAGPINNENDWINPQPISKPISHYLNMTVTNVDNYDKRG